MIYWHSPLDKKKSGIGLVSTGIRKDLQSFFDTIFINETIYNYDEGLHIYNIGNNYSNHGLIWWNSIQKPGITIIHDTNLHNLFKDIFFFNGDKNLHKFFKYKSYFNSLNPQSNGQFLELVSLNSRFYIVHSLHAKKLLKSIGINNCEKINLPFTSSIPKFKNKKNNDELNILIFGFLNNNRFVNETAEIVTELSSFMNIKLHIAGNIQDLKLKNEIIKNNNVIYHGFVENLSHIFDIIDIGINIRLPTMGESSESLLHFWAHSIPCVVVDSGAYSEINDNSVIKLPKTNTHLHLYQFLKKFNFTDEVYDKTKNAYNHLIKHHTVDNYCSQLFEIICSKSFSSDYINGIVNENFTKQNYNYST